MPWKKCLLAAAMLAGAAQAQPPIAVRVVVVTMFERGADTGDEPGEFQYWVERENLLRVLPFPQAYHHLRINRSGVLGVVTGVGTARAAATIMALGLDPRFDLSHAYWLVAGIGGVDPADASLGSAAWAEWVVDGDLAHEIDAREIPPAGRPATCLSAAAFPTNSRAATRMPARSTTSALPWSIGHTA